MLVRSVLTLTLMLLVGSSSLARDVWKESKLTGSPDKPSPYTLVRSYDGLSFDNPVLITSGPNDGRLYVLEQKGKLFSFEQSNHGVQQADLVIDLNEAFGAVAAYGFTFDPNFKENRFVYLTFIDGPNLEEGTRVARFRMRSESPPTIDPESEVEIIRWRSGGHNGGCLKFGPDGMLYISTGDAAAPSPPDGNNTGQGVDDLLSCILRLDVSNTSAKSPYTIPDDNPFVSMEEARHEIFAFGFRNPWRMSFDQQTGELWVGDVGWELWEMVFRVVSGGNYGWSVTEGPQPVRTDLKTGPGPVIPAVAAHHHSESRSITGGFVYRGKHDGLQGKYVYGDYVTGILWALTNEGNELTSLQEIARSTVKVIAFGEDSSGELLVLDYAGGIYKLEGNKIDVDPSAFPLKISETGLFNAEVTPASGVFEYAIAQSQWSDGAIGDRVIALQGEENVMLQRNGTMLYPEGTTLAKTLYLQKAGAEELTRLETQVMFLENKQWQFYTYAWREDQSDADLVPSKGAIRNVMIDDPLAFKGTREIEWRYHSRNECVTCHNSRSTVLGFVLPQLNGLTAGTGAKHDIALHSLIEDGVIQLVNPVGGKENAHKLAGLKEGLPSFHHGRDGDKAQIVKSYLAANCAHCHQPGGGGNATIDLRFQTEWDAMKLVNHRPTRGSLGIQDARIVSVGDPSGSVLLYRLTTTGLGHMPHLGAQTPDAKTIDLIRQWIDELDSPEAGELVFAVDVDVVNQRGNQPVSKALAMALDALSSARQQSLLAIRQKATGQEPPLELGLYKPFIDPALLPQTLGTNFDSSQIIKLQGDSENGRKLFLSTQGIQCKNCHQIGTDGKPVGPSLEDIAKRLGREEILESIVRPSAKIEAKYASYVVETTGGKVFSGVVKERNGKQLVILDAQGKQTAIPAAEVDFVERQDKSLMPDLQVKDLTAQQVADLVEFIKQAK